MRHLRTLLLLAFAALCIVPAEAKTPKGHLVIIGGGRRSDSVMDAFIKLAGGPDAKFLGISTASGTPEETGKGLVESLAKGGVNNAAWVAPTKEQSNDPQFVNDALDGVTGIFFSGGQQDRIVDSLRGSLFHQRLMQLYEDGAAIAGTSAGAAMMSVPMITGSRKDGSKDGFNSISADIVETVDGMGFIKGAIIDQHFMKRSRENRLFSVTLDNPEYISFGIDESTAIIVSKGRDIKVVGEGAVMVIEPYAKSISSDKKGQYRAKMKVSLLLAGDSYRIR